MSKLLVFSDGGSRGNPGPSAYGYVVYDEIFKLVAKGAGILGTRTNNFAEYYAFLQALSSSIDSTQILGVQDITFHLDSQLVVEQSVGNWDVKSFDLRSLNFAVKGRIQQLRLMGVTVEIKHIPRELNAEADELVNEILDDTQG
jgi:ribonuclease HI